METPDLASRLIERCVSSGATCTPHQALLLAAYVGLLTKWNKTINLTALSLDPLSDRAIDRLIVEPFVAARLVEQARMVPDAGGHVADLGSGGGSPAIPLKIAFPGSRLTMVESRARKAAFLRDAIRRLHLSESAVINARMEELASDGVLRESVDLLSVRAVRMDGGTWRAIGWLVAPGGTVLWFRAPAERLSIPASFARSGQAQLPADAGEVLLLKKMDNKLGG